MRAFKYDMKKIKSKINKNARLRYFLIDVCIYLNMVERNLD